MSSILHPNMAHGSTKWSCGLASWPVGFSHEAMTIRPTILKPACLTISRSTTPITPIRIGGRIRVNPSCERRRSVQRVVNNVMVGHGLALGPSDLNGPCIRPGLTNGPLHDWQRTYEMDI